MSFNTSSNMCNPMHKIYLNTTRQDTISSDTTRPDIQSPMSSSRKHSREELESSSISVSCEKRNFSQTFGNENEEQRYGQKITDTFFASNIGHCVISVNEENNKIGINNSDNNVGSDDKFQYKKSKETNDIQEIIDWCEFYRNNKNLFNV